MIYSERTVNGEPKGVCQEGQKPACLWWLPRILDVEENNNKRLFETVTKCDSKKKDPVGYKH
jgi:hypothetical protein